MGNAAGESVYGTMAPIIGAPPTGGMRRQRSRSFGDSAGAPGGPTPYASLPRHMADTAKSNAAAATPLPAKIGVSASERAAGGFSRMSQSRGTLTRSNRFNNKGRSGTMAFDSSTMSTMSTFNSPIGGGGGTRDLAMSSGTMAFGGPPSSGTMAFGGPPSRPPLAPPPSSGAPMFATMSRISGSGGGGGAALPPPIAMSATRALPPGPPPGAPPLESRISRMPEMPMLVVRASQGVLVDESGAEISLLGLLSDASTAMPMLKALCKAALFDERTLLESVCRGLDPHNVLRSVLLTAIDAEMADVGVGSNVFRDTASPASMLLCTYATLVAKAYIIDTCRAFLDELARDRTASDYNNLTTSSAGRPVCSTRRRRRSTTARRRSRGCSTRFATARRDASRRVRQCRWRASSSCASFVRR
jgi:hypothetical protein